MSRGRICSGRSKLRLVTSFLIVTIAGCSDGPADSETALIDTETTFVTTVASIDTNPGWRPLPAAPITGRVWYSTTWTGQELIIWGGVNPATGIAHDDGAIFDTSDEEWRLMSPSPLEARVGHAAVWTGQELIVWGGHSGGLRGHPARRFFDGAAYQPETDTWRLIATPDLTGGPGYASVWTGSEMIILGGNDGYMEFAENGLNEGAAYDPSTDGWRDLELPIDLLVTDAIWTGTEVVVYGIQHYLGPLFGVGYEPGTGVWRPLPTAPVGRPVPDIDRVGDQILAWSYDPEEDGIAALNTVTLEWRELPSLPGQPTEGVPTAASVGPYGVLMQSETVMAIYSAESREWRSIDTPAVNMEPYTRQPVWTGTEVLFFQAGLPPGDPNSPYGIPAQFWGYNPEH